MEGLIHRPAGDREGTGALPCAAALGKALCDRAQQKMCVVLRVDGSTETSHVA